MATTTETDVAESLLFYKMLLPPQCIHFVDSTDSEAFSLFVWTLRNSSIIAMDAEWKPVFNKSASAESPRVSIFQLACRLRAEAGTYQRTTEQPQGIKAAECDRSQDKPKAQERVGGKLSETNAEGEGRIKAELIFILDLLAVPASAFGRVLKDALVDSTVLKLGFGFKQDLIYLRSTFPRPDSHCCFDKVDPYLDIGKLYKHLHENTSSYMHRGKRISVGGDGLASIVEAILGLPLSKDMQCSNWEQRPLSPQQYDYAAADTYCLLAVFDALQIKASDSWFGPVEEEDGEDLERDDDAVVEGQSKVGVAELLCPPSSFSVIGGLAGVCLSRRGNAASMVEAALGISTMSPTKEEPDRFKELKSSSGKTKTLGVEKIVSRFGEKLLITGRESSSKRVRKARSRRARVGKSKELQDEDDVQWVGPPPWDSSVGGDEVPKFLCDAMVEGLARQLRCVGIDAASLNSKKCEPRELVDLAEREGRILLTRDVKLLRRRLVPTNLAYRVKRQGKWDQLSEIIEIFKLSISEEQLLTRCTKCNGDFVPKALSGEEAVARAPWSQVIPACALQNVDEFWQCIVCKHVYWQVHTTWEENFRRNILMSCSGLTLAVSC